MINKWSSKHFLNITFNAILVYEQILSLEDSCTLSLIVYKEKEFMLGAAEVNEKNRE